MVSVFKTKKYILGLGVLGLLMVIVLGGYIKFHTNFIPVKKEAGLSKVSVVIGSRTIVASVADTQVLQEKGLSGTASLSADQAMLFVFRSPSKYSFWMKDMHYPIDMIWLDSKKKVVFIKKHATPESYPEQFIPTTPAQYVLEVSDGFTDTQKVHVGDIVEFGL